MSVSEIVTSFPDYAKDIRLNYSKILNEGIFEKEILFSLILVSSLSVNLESLKSAALLECKDHLSEEILEDVYAAHAVMSMNAVYYRFTHLATEYDYASLPANLRMQYLTKYKTSKTHFEMLCLAVAVILGCGKCINAHEVVLRENEISNQKIQTVARIASIMNAIGNTLRVLKWVIIQ